MISSWISKIKHLILDAVFPPVKIKNAFLHQTMFCPVCRARLPDNKKICHKNSSYKLAAASNYDGEVKKLIWRLKYRRKTNAIQPLIYLMKNYLNYLFPDGFESVVKNWTIIPVPLHPKRERERGYNQAAFLAEGIGEFTGAPVLKDVLVKTRETKPQAETESWQERQENITGCFSVKNPDPIAGQNIILVDDVFTSGATMNEAVKTLRSAGARQIVALVIAKAG